MSKWKPVADGYTYKQPSYPVTSLTFHKNSLVISDRNTKEIVLPTDLRLCERVEVDRDREVVAVTLDDASRAADRLGGIVSGNTVTPDDYADLTTVRKWIAQQVEPVPVEAIRQVLVGIEMAYGTSEDSWQTVNAWLDKLEVTVGEKISG